MQHPKSNDQPGETIGGWVYFRAQEGALYRVRTSGSVDTPRPEFVVPSANAEFALRCARLTAGLPEYGTKAE